MNYFVKCLSLSQITVTTPEYKPSSLVILNQMAFSPVIAMHSSFVVDKAIFDYRVALHLMAQSEEVKA